MFIIYIRERKTVVTHTHTQHRNKLLFFGKMIFIVCEQKNRQKKLQTNAIYNIHNYIENTKI